MREARGDHVRVVLVELAQGLGSERELLKSSLKGERC